MHDNLRSLHRFSMYRSFPYHLDPFRLIILITLICRLQRTPWVTNCTNYVVQDSCYHLFNMMVAESMTLTCDQSICNTCNIRFFIIKVSQCNAKALRCKSQVVPEHYAPWVHRSFFFFCSRQVATILQLSMASKSTQATEACPNDTRTLH